MNTNTKITLANTSSLSDARAEATEIWGEVGNYPINNMTTQETQDEFEHLVYSIALGNEKFIKSFMEILTTFNHRSAD